MDKDKDFIGSSNMGNAGNQTNNNNQADLPKEYGDTKIVALVRDPMWIHVYWEVNRKKKEDLKNMLGDFYDQANFVLRVHDVTGIDFTGENSASYFDITVDKSAVNWYINTGNPDREFVVDLGMLTPTGQFILIARSNRIKTPRAGVSDVIDEKWMMVEEHYSEILRMSGTGSVGKASADIMGEITKRLFSDMNLSSGTLSSASSSSVTRKTDKEEDSFWFKVGTELIVYGETVPDAEVTINGNIIKLRPDGSFTLRFELPDGGHNFDIKAVSSNKKHKRQAVIDVNKGTK
ncbi:MAG: DUF4912 domain-containing protein [Candidatus Muiribacteriota bacterium]